VENVLALLSEVASAIAAEVKIALTPEQEQLLAGARPVRPEVQEEYLLGRHAGNSFTRAGWEKALAHFRKAVDLDPEFAPAWASLAYTHLLRAVFGVAPLAEGRTATVEAARRALELDPTLATAYGALGASALYLDWDWPAARENLTRAVELDPTNAMVRHGYADLLLIEGKPEESLAQVELGRQYDPLNPLANGVVLGHLFFVHRYDELLAEADRIATVLPDLFNLSTYRSRALWHLGRRDEALRVRRQGWAERAPGLAAALDRGAARGGPRGAMVAIAEALERGGAEPLDVAQYYALAGDNARAMAMLERGYAAHSPFILHIKADPAYDDLRADPRFADLIRRIGFPS
jgi:tetratricopeptide (TPR) repeat protein